MYICTRLDTATMKKSQDKLICGSDKEVNAQLAMDIIMKYANLRQTYILALAKLVKGSRVNKFKTLEICSEQPYVNTQLNIAIRNKGQNKFCLLYTSPSPRDS